MAGVVTDGCRAATLALLLASGAAALADAPQSHDPAARDLTAKEVTTLVFKAPAGTRPNLEGKILSRLDLSNLDFKGADLKSANLFGTELSGAHLNDTNLGGALLDRATVVGTNFDGANLEGASLQRLSAFTTLTPVVAEAPSFRGANLRGAKIFGRFSLSNFAGADLTAAIGAPVNRTGFIEHIWRTELSGANLTNARMHKMDLTRALLSFANCRGADMSQAILRDADLSGADLTGVDLTGADLTNADLTDADVSGTNLAGTNLRGTRGLDFVKGMALARNADKTIR